MLEIYAALLLFISDDAWKVATQSGFNAVLVLVLLGFLYIQRKEEREEREKNRKSMDLLTRSVTDLLLSVHFVPQPLKEAAKERVRTLDEQT